MERRPLPETIRPVPNPFEKHESAFSVSAVSIPKSEAEPNEDALFESTDPDGNGGTFVVMDGMGGYSGGEIASSIVRDTIAKENWRFERIQQDRIAGKDVGPGLTAEYEVMRVIMKLANDELLAKRKTLDKKYKGMGTVGTVARLVRMKDGRMETVIGHLGDTRASVQYPDGRLETLTLDAHITLTHLAKDRGMETALAAQAVLDELSSDVQYEELLGLLSHPEDWPTDLKIRPSDILFLDIELGFAWIHYYFESRNGVAEFFGREDPTFHVSHAFIPDGGKLILTSDGTEGLYGSEIRALLSGEEEMKGMKDQLVASAGRTGKTPAGRVAEGAKARAEEGPTIDLRSKGHDDTSAIAVEIPKRLPNVDESS